MLARYLNAPLLLLLWQVAPVDLRRDEGGPIRISFGAGRGEFAFRDYPGYAGGVDCFGASYAGRGPYSEASDYASGGGAAEVWARNNLRILAALGSINDASGERDGIFGAGQVIFEQKKFGLGVGLASFGGGERDLHPSGSVRVGSLDGVSLRADYHFPQAGVGLIGGPRIGVGLNQGRGRKPRLFVGMATTPVPDSARKVGGFFELAFPLGFFKGKAGLSVNGFLSGAYSGNQDKQIYALGLGGWIQP